MRDFFKKEVLDRTYEIFGVRQTDEEKMSDDDIRFLLDGLCQVSKNYEYIPQDEQKKIIRACMLSDKTYRNINLRLVAGWLEMNGKKYFKEKAHTDSDTVYLTHEYTNLINFWKENVTHDPTGKRLQFAQDNYDRVLDGENPIDDIEGIRIMFEMFKKNFVSSSIKVESVVKGGGSRLREQFKELHTEPPKPEEAVNANQHAVKSFLVEGIEVFANTQEEANEIFYGKPSNEKGVQRPDQNTEVSDNSPENQ